MAVQHKELTIYECFVKSGDNFFQRGGATFLLTGASNIRVLFSQIRMRQGQFPRAAAAAILRAERSPGAGAVRLQCRARLDEATCNEIREPDR